MLQLSALAIALHGIGYGTLLTALQGLLAVSLFEPAAQSLGGHAALKVRHKTRRYKSLAVALTPFEAIGASEADDEELLLSIGAL